MYWSTLATHLPPEFIQGVDFNLVCSQGLDSVYFIMILNKRYVAIAFLSEHQRSKLDLPRAFIFTLFLSSDTNDPSPIFLGSIFYKYIWLPRSGALRELHQHFLATEEPLRNNSLNHPQWLLR